jgi:hypothetical protein
VCKNEEVSHFTVLSVFIYLLFILNRIVSEID